MDTLLIAVFIITMPTGFIVTLSYFIVLYKFKNAVAKEYPEIWAQEKTHGRPFESWAQPAYRVLKKAISRADNRLVFCGSAGKHAIAAKNLLYTGMIIFIVCLFSFLALTFIEPVT